MVPSTGLNTAHLTTCELLTPSWSYKIAYGSKEPSFIFNNRRHPLQEENKLKIRQIKQGGII